MGKSIEVFSSTKPCFLIIRVADHFKVLNKLLVLFFICLLDSVILLKYSKKIMQGLIIIFKLDIVHIQLTHSQVTLNSWKSQLMQLLYFLRVISVNHDLVTCYCTRDYRLSILQTAKPEESSNTVGSTTSTEQSSTHKHPKKVRNSGEISSTHFLLNLFNKYSNIKYLSHTCFNIRVKITKLLIKKSDLVCL